MDIFTDKGMKFLLATFIFSFIAGGLVAIIGFCMVVDLMAKG